MMIAATASFGCNHFMLCRGISRTRALVLLSSSRGFWPPPSSFWVGSPTSIPHHCLQRTQYLAVTRRCYVFIPTTWRELQADLNQWLRRQKHDKQTVLVRLLRDKTRDLRHRSNQRYDAAKRRVQYRLHTTRKRLLQRAETSKLKWERRMKRMQMKLQTRLRSSRTWAREQLVAMDDLRGRKHRAPLHGPAGYSGASNSLLQRGYQWYRRSRSMMKRKLKAVVLQEYSQRSWFDPETGRPLTSRDAAGRFVNPWNSQSTNGVHDLMDLVKWRWQRWLQNGSHRMVSPKLKLQHKASKRTPSFRFDPDSTPSQQLQLTWLGHSTCWVELAGYRILTDPMFSMRAAPFQWATGVERLVPPVCRVRDLPNSVDVCLISHDHYDHLDRLSCIALRPKVKVWCVPLGIKDWLVRNCGIAPEKIIELSWWESCKLTMKKASAGSRAHASSSMTTLGGTPKSLEITCTPTQHWGTRWPWDRNKRLWCSWVVASPQQRFYFGGDTGYPPSGFPLFRQIGDALGPFDLAALPIGAYAPRFFMKDSHVHPSEAVKIHQELQSRRSIAIHHGSFPLSDEALDEPPKELRKAVVEAGLEKDEFVSIPMGDTIKGTVQSFGVPEFVRRRAVHG